MSNMMYSIIHHIGISINPMNFLFEESNGLLIPFKWFRSYWEKLQLQNPAKVIKRIIDMHVAIAMPEKSARKIQRQLL